MMPVTTAVPTGEVKDWLTLMMSVPELAACAGSTVVEAIKIPPNKTPSFAFLF